jgi:beta-lactamase regulating signal transducer with metallopeptidase domain/ankyrin repeat protein
MIAPFLRELEQLFGWLLAASWQASVLALFVLVIQRILGSRLNPRWRYALWMLVILRLVLPVLPESTLSLFQFAPTPPAQLMKPVTEPWQPLFTGKPYPSPQDAAPVVIPNYPFSYFTLLTLLWMAGAGILLVLTWQVNRRFARQVANSPAISDPELLELFAEAKTELGIRRPIRLIENEQLQSPAIMGLFQPTLLLPADVRKKFDTRELRFIFLHELAHLKRGDVMVQALIALLQILHWFNPVLWFAFRRMRIDREPATDALVLSRTGEEEKERYGLMLIKLLEHFNQRHSLPTLVGILEDKDQFKRRFSLIARFTRGAYGWSLLGILIIGILSVACLTAKESDTANASAKPMKINPPPIYVWYNKIGLGFFGPIRGDAGLSDESHIRGTDHTLSVWCKSFTATDETLVFIESWPIGPRHVLPDGGSSQPVSEKRTEKTVPVGKVYSFQIFDSVDVTTSPTLKPDSLEKVAQGAEIKATEPPNTPNQQVQTYLEVDYIETTDASGMAGGMTTSKEEAQALIFNPKNKLTAPKLVYVPLGVGTNTVSFKKPSDVNWTVTVNWKDPLATKEQDITVKAEWPNANGGAVSYGTQFTAKLGLNECYVVTGPWKTKETSKIIIRYVEQPQKGDADTKPTDANPQMLEAVQKGDAATLQKLIDEGVDPKTIHGEMTGQTLLFSVRNPAIAAILIQHGVDVNVRANNGETAMQSIGMRNKQPADIIRVLLEYGADANARDNDGGTPLRYAPDAATVDLLVEHGADVKVRDKNGMGVLSNSSGNAGRMKALIKHGAPFDPKTDGPTLMMNAAWMDHVDVIVYLLGLGVDPNLKGTWNKEADMYMTPLQASVTEGHLDVAKVLLDHGARVEPQIVDGKPGPDEMDGALVNRHEDIVKLFWDHGVRNISELTYAISQGAPVGEVQKLLDNGMRPDPPEDKFITPLGLAAELGRLDIVTLLVQRGAEINGHVASRESPLDQAASEGQDEVVDYLLHHGAQVEYQALWDAAWNSHPYEDQRSKDHFENTVKLLIDAGTLKKITPEQSGQILDAAIDTRYPDGNATVLKMLLDAGLSPELPITDKSGKRLNSVIGYYRDLYIKDKDSTNLVSGIKPMLDMLEAADKGAGTNAN